MTRVVIHGMIENYQAPWYDQMRQAFLDTEDSNVIFVDWSKTNHFPYTQVTANTQMVGAEVSLLINELIANHGADPQLIHLIGHSLGAHAAGYAGSRIVPRVSRITGLDPAGPYFEWTDPLVRLDPTDDQFVDVIHTDGQRHAQLGLGLLQPLGHVDFYPNGGLEQPQCPKMTGKIWNAIINALNNEESLGKVQMVYLGFVDTVLCSHLFSVYTFTDSIRNSNCSYVSIACSSMEKLTQTDECSRNAINRMGLHASSFPQVSFYLSTQDANIYPYCRRQIIMLLKSNSVYTRILSFNGSLQNVEPVSITVKTIPNQMYQPIRQVIIFDIERHKSVTLCPTSEHHLRFELC
ncbi:unnamed protein product [Rotaria socialis]|uniref:Lipase domain-containing protein n=2 Tax=Rotaria socialis TaxID=392032 RepID=A0A820UDM1_9BILA|nr:unnamed protein product [Rotaria socialis]